MSHPPPQLSTGSAGLDRILGGGVPGGRMYLVQGPPGSGKTTLGVQFLRAGVGAGEPTLFVTLSETEAELREVAASHGWDLRGVEVCDLQPSAEAIDPGADYTLFHPAEVELSQTTGAIMAAARRLRPRRVVIDSLAELRLLSHDLLRYRRQVLSLKHQLGLLGCTTLFLDSVSAGEVDSHLASMAHGVLVLEQSAPAFGAQRRRLRWQKVRGLVYSEGHHDYEIRIGGVEVYPRLVARDRGAEFHPEPVSSGLAGLDELLGGGPDRGTSCLILGASGVGKSALAALYALAAAARGERATLFLFDEGRGAWLERTRSLGYDPQPHLDAGTLELCQLNPAEVTPGGLAQGVVERVESRGVRVIVIDTLNGYMAAMPDEQLLSLHVHELVSYLNGRGVLTILTMVQHGLVGSVEAPLEVSYLTDTVLYLRYFEAQGEVRKCLSVIKKRTGNHERQLRELRFDPEGGVTIGEQLRAFTGVLTGVPRYEGVPGDLMADQG